MIAAGSLKRRVTLWQPITVTSATGTVKTSWEAAATVWAKQEMLSLRKIERMAGLADAAEAKFLIRYRQGVTNALQIEYNGKHYGVVSVEETDNREALRLLVRAI